MKPKQITLINWRTKTVGSSRVPGRETSDLGYIVIGQVRDSLQEEWFVTSPVVSRRGQVIRTLEGIYRLEGKENKLS